MINIFHIGFSKCASSWLQNFFKSTDEIYYLEKTHFFSPLYKKSIFFSKNDYPIQKSKIHKNQIVLESDEHIILPDYCKDLFSNGTTINNVKKVIDKISIVFPSAKIILVIRNQSSLIVSRYSQYVIGGGDKSFQEYFSILNGVDLNTDYFQNYYFKIISYLFMKFNKNNVHIIFQENLKNHKEIKFLSDFVGIDIPKLKTNIFTRRKGLSMIGLYLLRKLNTVFVLKPRTFNTSIKTIIPKFIYLNFIVRSVRLIDYFLFNSDKFKLYNLLTHENKNFLKNKFSNDNKKLFKLFDNQIISSKYYFK